MEKKKTFMEFVKENAFFLVLGFCIVAIGVSLTLMFTIGASSNVYEPSIETDVNDTFVDVPMEPSTPTSPQDKVIEFLVPVSNGTVVRDYTEALSYNATLNRYEQHKAIDYLAEEGANVYAVYDGIVESVTTSITKGVTVVINHGNGLKTIYNSLADGNDVWEGKSLLKGDIIGSVSTTNRQEHLSGAHLHFQTELNGKIINPSVYFLTDENK